MRLRRVVGKSMIPALMPDQIVVVARPGKLRSGDLVVVQREVLEEIKRVTKVANDRIYLLGDNGSVSIDSRQYGWLHKSVVTGKVIWCMSDRAKGVIWRIATVMSMYRSLSSALRRIRTT